MIYDIGIGNIDILCSISGNISIYHIGASAEKSIVQGIRRYDHDGASCCFPNGKYDNDNGCCANCGDQHDIQDFFPFAVLHSAPPFSSRIPSRMITWRCA